MRVLLLCVCAVAACARRSQDTIVKDEDAAPPADVATQKGRPPPRWPESVPDAHASCKTHDECAVLIEAPQTDPCCTHRVFLPVTRAYADWTSRYREEHCRDVICPSQPLPGPEPACCASIGRCVDHKCISGCSDPTLDAPKVDWLDSSCRLRKPD